MDQPRLLKLLVYPRQVESWVMLTNLYKNEIQEIIELIDQELTGDR